VYNQG